MENAKKITINGEKYVLWLTKTAGKVLVHFNGAQDENIENFVSIVLGEDKLSALRGDIQFIHAAIAYSKEHEMELMEMSESIDDASSPVFFSSHPFENKELTSIRPILPGWVYRNQVE